MAFGGSLNDCMRLHRMQEHGDALSGTSHVLWSKIIVLMYLFALAAHTDTRMQIHTDMEHIQYVIVTTHSQ